jgi:hypothetical protein
VIWSANVMSHVNRFVVALYEPVTEGVGDDDRHRARSSEA